METQNVLMYIPTRDYVILKRGVLDSLGRVCGPGSPIEAPHNGCEACVHLQTKNCTGYPQKVQHSSMVLKINVQELLA